MFSDILIAVDRCDLIYYLNTVVFICAPFEDCLSRQVLNPSSGEDN